MKKNLNRRKFFKLRKKNIFISILILILISFFFLIYINNLKIKYYFNNNLQKFSEYFDYQLKSVEITGLKRTNNSELENILTKYYGVSIFLLPLNEISKNIKENVWIKNIELSINYKNNLIIKVVEYSPIGLFNFNNKLFYFDSTGNIIDEYLSNDGYKENLIIFSGELSNKKAFEIFEIINMFDNNFALNISNIDFIEKRRWNILLKNNIILKLSEENPYKSIENYNKIVKNLSEAQINNVVSIDLRNITKSIIKFKND